MNSNKNFEKDSSYLFIGLLFLFVALSAGMLFYKFVVTGNYDYLVEASCDPSLQTCFQRDCTNPDDCPVNQLSTYREFIVESYDFPKCEDNSCLKECLSESIKCREIACDPEIDECSSAEVTETPLPESADSVPNTAATTTTVSEN